MSILDKRAEPSGLVNPGRRLMAIGSLIAMLSSGPAVSAAERHVTVTLTEHGIPHVVARDWTGLGYGEGYALARNDLCSIANAIATYSGRRAQRYGVEGSFMAFAGAKALVPNAQEDLVQRFLINDEVVKRARAKMSSRARALVDGFAAGYNAYVAALPPENRPEACRGEGVIQPITGDDVIRRIHAVTILDGAEAYRSELLAAAPPSPERKTEAPPSAAPKSALGSNALAIGRDLTVNGSGLLLANPHFFWDGPDHFVVVHLTIPGRFDAMGAALNAHPAILIGFNRSLAWTRTSSTDAHAAFYRLKLDPADPTRYLVDGRSIPMRRSPVTVPTRDENGRPGVAQHVFWTTQFGPVVVSAQMPWSHNEAYALADPNRLNVRALDEDLQIASARRVEPLRARLQKSVGSGFVNTFAADATGKTLFAAMAPVLAFDAAKYRNCRSESATAPWWRPPVFDGSRSDCAPTRYKDAPERWVLPGLMKPSLIRTDYVANSNDSYWLTNAHQPLEGFSPIIGRERMPQRERQRTGHLMIRERISSTDGLPGNRFDVKTLETLLFQNRNLTADLVTDDLVAACRRTPAIDMEDGAHFDLSHACDVLGRWDRRQDLGSIGAAIFREFAYQALTDGIYPDRFWKTPFDLKDPVGTPRGLTDDPATVLAILRSLAKAVARLGKVGIPIDVPLGQVQFVERNGRRIPLHGGPTMTTYNAMDNELIPNLGYTHPSMATSYVQVVGFGPHGPEADAILANSQSSDPASSFYADQTEMYSQKQWIRLPFTREDVASHAIAPPLVLRVSP